MSKESRFEVEERKVETVLVASIRWKGRYDECGERFSRLYKAMGRHACGKPMNLLYDEGYKENDADIETCIPVRKGKEVGDISVRKLEGGRCASLIHKGPYDDFGRTYELISAYLEDKGYEVVAPCREIYIKGPGMIFKGNPKNYLTEIQFMIKE